MSFSTSAILSSTIGKPIYATNLTIYEIVRTTIRKYGSDCSLNHIDVSGVTSFDHLFCEMRFEHDKYPDMSEWDTSNVKSINCMFCNSNFNGDITMWNMKSLITANFAFLNAFNFEHNLSSWHCPKLTIQKDMFLYAHKFNRLPNPKYPKTN